MTLVKNSPSLSAGLRSSSHSIVVDDTGFLDGNDIILSMDGNDIILSMDGNDIILSMDGNDIILSMDGNDVRKIDDVLTNLQREKSLGNTLILGILKDGQMSLTLEKRPDY